MFQVPIMLQRLHNLQKEMHAEFIQQEASRGDDTARHFSVFGSPGRSPAPGTGLTSPNKAVFSPNKSQGKSDSGVSPNKAGIGGGGGGVVSPSKRSPTKLVEKPGKVLAEEKGVKKDKEINGDVNHSVNSASLKTDTIEKLCSEEDEKDKVKSEFVSPQRSVRVSKSQVPCSSDTSDIKQSESERVIEEKPTAISSAKGPESDSEEELGSMREDITVEERKARLKRTLSPSYYSEDVYRLKRQKTRDDSSFMCKL